VNEPADTHAKGIKIVVPEGEPEPVPTERRRVVVGSLGHVDHGKTALTAVLGKLLTNAAIAEAQKAALPEEILDDSYPEIEVASFKEPTKAQRNWPGKDQMNFGKGGFKNQNQRGFKPVRRGPRGR